MKNFTYLLITIALLLSTNAWSQDPQLLLDIYPGSANGSEPRDFKVSGNHLFFIADEPVYGVETWATDLTTFSTYLLKNISSNDAFPDGFVEMNGLMYFYAYPYAYDYELARGLWRTDGTPAGTTLIQEFEETFYYFGESLSGLMKMGNELYFSADTAGFGIVLVKSDGTLQGTEVVAPNLDFNSPANMTGVNGTLFFVATDPTHGFDLWKTDGSEAGTAFVAEVVPGNQGNYSLYTLIGNLNGKLLFVADDHVNGTELWKSDGTAGGTVLIKDINPGHPGGATASYGNNTFTIIYNGICLFQGNDGAGGRELWKTDGTTAGTKLVKNIGPGFTSSDPAGFVELNGIVYFAADDLVNGRELWRTNGTSAGTYLVKDINPTESSNPESLIVANGRLYFIATNGIDGYEIWTSDGTPCGTYMINEIFPGPVGSLSSLSYERSNLASDGNFIYTRAYSPEYSFEPWRFSINPLPSPLKTSVSSTTLCPGDVTSVIVSFPPGCTGIGGNVFTVELSDAQGSFSTPTIIGSIVSGNLSDTVTCNIPNLIPFGEGYRIRATASNPATIGEDNGVDITITCPVPQDFKVVNITNSSAKLKWDPITCAEKFMIKYRQEGSSDWITVKPVTNSQKISGLAPNTSYEAKVRSKCAKSPDVYSSYTSLIQWTTSVKLSENEHAIENFLVYPNPVSDFVTIEFTLKNSSDVSIGVFDLQGRKIKTITDGTLESGTHHLQFDCGDLSAGTYFLQLIRDFEMEVKKLTIE